MESVQFCAGEGSWGDIDVSGTGEAPFQRSVLVLNSECSYEFLVLGLLSRDSGYSFLYDPYDPISYPTPSTPYSYSSFWSVAHCGFVLIPHWRTCARFVG